MGNKQALREKRQRQDQACKTILHLLQPVEGEEKDLNTLLLDQWPHLKEKKSSHVYKSLAMFLNQPGSALRFNSKHNIHYVSLPKYTRCDRYLCASAALLMMAHSKLSCRDFCNQFVHSSLLGGISRIENNLTGDESLEERCSEQTELFFKDVHRQYRFVIFVHPQDYSSGSLGSAKLNHLLKRMMPSDYYWSAHIFVDQ